MWPTAKSRVEKMRFSTEEFAGRVIDEVALRPAAYALSLTNRKVTGSLIAMSVFKPDLLPPLSAARGRAYYLLHSPDDARIVHKGTTIKVIDFSGLLTVFFHDLDFAISPLGSSLWRGA